MKLSRRLQQIADYIAKGSRVADVGTDHALLPIYLVQSGQADAVIATDVAQGPVLAAQANVAKHKASPQISVRLGDGLQTVSPGEVDTVVIAGMGGGTAVHIMEQSPQVVAHVRRVIIQPMNASRQVREYLRSIHFGLVDECLFADDGRFYEVLVADVDASPTAAYDAFGLDEPHRWLALEYGPFILNRSGDDVLAYLKEVRGAMQQVLHGVEQGKTETAMMRKQTVIQQLTWLENWMSEKEGLS